MIEKINKIFHRIELDKANDSCGFEFADGFSCTFDNIATCYDDRLKLYEIVKQLQQENQQLCNEIDIWNDKYNAMFYEYINYMDKKDFAKKCNISRPYLDKLLKTGMTRLEIYKFCLTRNKISNKENV